MAEIINKINTQDNKTILIEGVLNKYDEELFTAICSECKDRCLIFTISDMKSYLKKITLTRRNKHTYIKHC